MPGNAACTTYRVDRRVTWHTEVCEQLLTHKNDVDSAAMTSEHFEDLLKQALTGLPPELQQQAAEVVTAIMCDPPPRAPKESLVAFVQGPTHLRLEVYKNSFDEGTEEEVLEK